MLSLLLFFVILALGCLPYCALADRKFEEALPLSCMTLTLIAFLMGLLFRRGLYQVGSVSVIYSFIPLIEVVIFLVQKRADGKRLMKNFFSPGFFLFLLGFGYLAALNYGRLCHEFDALSHWGDVVKAMVQTGALATSPLSQSTFQSYPPAISLFQLVEQEAAILSGGAFAEWRIYHAFQILILAFLLPLVKNLDFKKPWAWLCSLALFLAPTFLFEGVYRYIYVDPMLGVISAAGLAAVLLEKRRDGFYRAYVLACAAMLVLTKDAGLAFAVILVALFLYGELAADGRRLGVRLKSHWGVIALAALSLLLPWGLWKMSIVMNQASQAFPDPIRWGQLFRILTFRDDSYRKVIRDLFLDRMVASPSSASLLGISLRHVTAFALILTVFLFLCKRCIRRDPERAGLFRLAYWLTLLELVLYMLGILIMYLFKFSEYEAMQLASLNRYVAVPLLSVWLLCVFMAVDLIAAGTRDRNLLAAALFCLVLIATPDTSLQGLISRQEVGESIAYRQPATDLEQAFNAKYQGAPARIYFISQEDDEYHKFMVKLSLRPHIVSCPLGWSLSDGERFFEGDEWSRGCTAEQLHAELLENYDFLLTYQMNEDFKERFASLFAVPEDIGPMRIYALNRGTGLLELYAQA